MPNALVSIMAALAVIATVTLVACLTQKGRVKWGWLLAAGAVVICHDALLTGLWIRALPSIGEDWNWSGKIAALLASLAIAVLPMVGFTRSGITWRQDPKGLRGALIMSGALAAIFIALAVFVGGEGGSAETFAFQLTMPGLEEELFYRGVLLLMLNEAFGRPVKVAGASMGWAAILTSLAFGLDHALGYGSQGLSFDPLALALTGGPALLLVWLRERSGSLVLPVILHNFANTIFMVV